MATVRKDPIGVAGGVQAYSANLAALAAVTAADPVRRSAVITVSTAQILALHTTPITLVAAPGANKYIRPVGIALKLEYNTAAYGGIAAGDDLGFYFTSAAGQFVAGMEATGFLDTTATKYADVSNYAPVLDTVGTNATSIINAPLVIALTAAITTGDSPLKVVVDYQIIDVATLFA